jgi:hypothetical protein
MLRVRHSLLLLLALAGPVCAAQSCPEDVASDKEPPPSTLTGTIHHYRQLREWIGLDLDKAACGEKTIQLIFVVTHADRAESLDGCSARVKGSIYESPTGYYSANLAISDPVIDPSPDCRAKPVPATKATPPPADLRSYAYSVVVNIPGNVPITGSAWRTDGKPGDLAPWAAYADITLTGGYVIWADCRKGFVPVAASSSTRDDASVTDVQAGLDPSEDRISRFVVSCQKSQPGPNLKTTP